MDLILCSVCQELRPSDEFYKDASKKSGRRNECKMCTNQSYRVQYLTRRDDYKARSKKWREENPERYQEARKAGDKKPKDTQKVKARNAVNNAISDGRFRPVGENTCVYCGGRAEQYHHHNGYSDDRLLDVIAVCRRCHIRVHEYRLEQENGGWK